MTHGTSKIMPVLRNCLIPPTAKEQHTIHSTDARKNMTQATVQFVTFTQNLEM